MEPRLYGRGFFLHHPGMELPAHLRPHRETLVRLRSWRDHPDVFVRELFQVTPDPWQDEALKLFPHSPRLAMRACAGPGKTATLAWLGWNFMLTRPHPAIGATSITGDNLKANLWTELARWREKSDLLRSQFEMTKTEIFAKDHPKTWKMEARTWPKNGTKEEIVSALRGLHAKYVMWLLDETGDYPDAILPVCESIFAGDPIEAHIVQAGNPSRRGGPLYHAAVTARDLWRVVEITGDPDNPNRSPRIPIEYAREQIKQYGRNNPFVKVVIFGEFPDADFNALIGPEEVREAMRRFYRDYEIGEVAKVLGVDVARQGDDSSIVFPRRGIQAFTPKRFRNLTSTEGASVTAGIWNSFGADACFVDDTGGFGSGWLDQLRQLGHQPIGIHFSGRPHDPARFYNKRAEMYFDAVEWIKRGGALPEDDELLKALTQTNYTFQGERLILEPKEDVKAKIGCSPDVADAFCLSFAEPVVPKTRARAVGYSAAHEYNPYAMGPISGISAPAARHEYDPYP